VFHQEFHEGSHSREGGSPAREQDVHRLAVARVEALQHWHQPAEFNVVSYVEGRQAR
jgi:hypothetical protein